MNENKRYVLTEYNEINYITDRFDMPKYIDTMTENEIKEWFIKYSMNGKDVVDRLNNQEENIENLSDDYVKLMKENIELKRKIKELEKDEISVLFKPVKENKNIKPRYFYVENGNISDGKVVYETKDMPRKKITDSFYGEIHKGSEDLLKLLNWLDMKNDVEKRHNNYLIKVIESNCPKNFTNLIFRCMEDIK